MSRYIHNNYSYSTNNNDYYFGICEFCNEKEVNAFYNCRTAKYCRDCITKLGDCPICEKPEDILIISFSDYGRRLNINTIKNKNSQST